LRRKYTADEYLAKCAQNLRDHRARLSPCYVRSLLVRNSTLTTADIPDWMVELKRAQLRLARATAGGM
jgi:hypothetical protein